MNLSVLVVESSIASTNQIAKGMLLALIKFVKFTPTNLFAIACVQTSAKRALLCSWEYFIRVGERFTEGTGTSFSVP